MHYFLVRYRHETIGVCATVLTVETCKRMTGLLVSIPVCLIIITDTHRYWRVSVDTQYRYRSNPIIHSGLESNFTLL